MSGNIDAPSPGNGATANSWMRSASAGRLDTLRREACPDAFPVARLLVITKSYPGSADICMCCWCCWPVYKIMAKSGRSGTEIEVACHGRWGPRFWRRAANRPPKVPAIRREECCRSATTGLLNPPEERRGTTSICCLCSAIWASMFADSSSAQTLPSAKPTDG